MCCPPALARLAGGAAIAGLLAFLPAMVASAHETSTSYSRVTIEGNAVRVAFTMNLLELHLGPTVDADGDEVVTYDELDEGIESLYAAIKKHYQLRVPEEPTAVLLERYDLSDENTVRMQILFTFDRAVSGLMVASTLPAITQPNHQHLLRLDDGTTIRQAVLDASQPIARLDMVDSATLGRTVAGFLHLGVGHIFTGYDHLAFLVGLLIGTSGLIALVKVVTSFTVAHSVTLGLASFGLVSLPPRLIECLIALSIAYVAIENMWKGLVTSRWSITFLFGLVHGFGFSNVLRELGLPPGRLAVSLFSFNIGVEVGQVAFVAAVFPILLFIRSSRWKTHLTAMLSLGIMALGFYWFVERAFPG